MSEKAIITNVCMVYDGKRLLLQDRVDESYKGVIFPGGHVEKGESFVKAVMREVFEETGLTIEQPQLCGIKQWQTERDERYIVLFYKTDKFSGELHSSDEGEVFWANRCDLHKYKTTNDFYDALKIFDDDTLTEFFYEQTNGEWQPVLL